MAILVSEFGLSQKQILKQDESKQIFSIPWEYEFEGGEVRKGKEDNR
jgi:hypothetical protein